MKLISFKDKFPNKVEMILVYKKSKTRKDKYAIIDFGHMNTKKYNTYLYLVNNFTHWIYIKDMDITI